MPEQNKKYKFLKQETGPIKYHSKLIFLKNIFENNVNMNEHHKITLI